MSKLYSDLTAGDRHVHSFFYLLVILYNLKMDRRGFDMSEIKESTRNILKALNKENLSEQR